MRKEEEKDRLDRRSELLWNVKPGERERERDGRRGPKRRGNIAFRELKASPPFFLNAKGLLF